MVSFGVRIQTKPLFCTRTCRCISIGNRWESFVINWVLRRAEVWPQRFDLHRSPRGSPGQREGCLAFTWTNVKRTPSYVKTGVEGNGQALFQASGSRHRNWWNLFQQLHANKVPFFNGFTYSRLVKVKKFEEQRPTEDGAPPPSKYYSMNFKYAACSNQAG